MSKYSILISTFSDRQEASKIADILLRKKLIACVNILSGMESRYWWKGKIEKGQEILAIIKTRKSLVDKVIMEIKTNHSYAVPEVIELPILRGNKDYLKWIDEVTRYR